MIHALIDIGNAALWGSSVLIVVFIIQYTALAKWWKNPIGVTIVGLDLCILAIFIPSLLAQADPSGFAHFATARWYQMLATGIVVFTFAFVATRVATWEWLRRKRRHLLPNGENRDLPKGDSGEFAWGNKNTKSPRTRPRKPTTTGCISRRTRRGKTTRITSTSTTTTAKPVPPPSATRGSGSGSANAATPTATRAPHPKAAESSRAWNSTTPTSSSRCRTALTSLPWKRTTPAFPTPRRSGRGWNPRPISGGFAATTTVGRLGRTRQPTPTGRLPSTCPG